MTTMMNQFGSSLLSEVRLGGFTEPEPELETAIVLTPKQELEQFGLTEEMSSKYLQIISVISTYIPELKTICEIDIFKHNIVMITKIIFKYWDDPDKGVHEVLRYVKLYD